MLPCPWTIQAGKGLGELLIASPPFTSEETGIHGDLLRASHVSHLHGATRSLSSLFLLFCRMLPFRCPGEPTSFRSW